jgi:hypothetical protein
MSLLGCPRPHGPARFPSSFSRLDQFELHRRNSSWDLIRKRSQIRSSPMPTDGMTGALNSPAVRVASSRSGAEVASDPGQGREWRLQGCLLLGRRSRGAASRRRKGCDQPGRSARDQEASGAGLPRTELPILHDGSRLPRVVTLGRPVGSLDGMQEVRGSNPLSSTAKPQVRQYGSSSRTLRVAACCQQVTARRRPNHALRLRGTPEPAHHVRRGGRSAAWRHGRSVDTHPGA